MNKLKIYLLNYIQEPYNKSKNMINRNQIKPITRQKILN